MENVDRRDVAPGTAIRGADGKVLDWALRHLKAWARKRQVGKSALDAALEGARTVGEVQMTAAGIKKRGG